MPSVDKFDYASWDSQVLLERDHDGHPVVTVTETVVASFPDHDQNRGIVRGIPSPGSQSIRDIRVTDGGGEPVPFDREYDSSSRMLYVLVGTDAYVHGDQTYVINYRTDEGVVGDPRTGVQELYWNLLPLDSAQAIQRFTATVRIDPELSHALTGQHACYQGRFGSTDTCDLQVRTTEDGSTVHTFGSDRRAPGDGVTVAIGFVGTTFNGVTTANAMAPPSMLRTMYDNGTIGALVAAVAMAVAWVGSWMHRRFTAALTAADPRPSRLPPMPQGGVPVTLPPPVAAALLRADRVQRGKEPGTTKAVAGRAEIIHLAVQGAIRFEGEPGRSRLSVRLLDRELARHPIDQQMLDILFAGRPGPGTVHALPRKDTAFADSVRSMDKAGRRAAAAQGLLRLRSSLAATVAVAVGAVLGVGSLVLAVLSPRPLSVVMALVAVGVAIVTGSTVLTPEPMLTERGRPARDLLRSVRAHLDHELEHQGEPAAPRGAEAVDHDGTEVLQVYERLLPYALLFGLAEKWSELLATRYESQHPPAWMVGGGSGFHHYWRYVDRSVRTSGTYVAPSSSGGGGYSGGSSGGGFSGGGGGGGFSGGR